MENVEFLSAGRTISFRSEIARLLDSIPAAILYQHLLFWSDKGKRGDGFIYKSRIEIEEETTLSVKQIRLATKKLVESEWLDVKKIMVNGTPTMHYKCLKSITTVVFSDLSKGQMESDKRANVDLSKGQMYIGNSNSPLYNNINNRGGEQKKEQYDSLKLPPVTSEERKRAVDLLEQATAQKLYCPTLSEEPHQLLILWEKTLGRKIRTKIPENMRAAERLVADLGEDYLTELLKVCRVCLGDKYAGTAMFVACSNYVGLEKNIERIEAYAQGIKDRPRVSQELNARPTSPNFTTK